MIFLGMFVLVMLSELIMFYVGYRCAQDTMLQTQLFKNSPSGTAHLHAHREWVANIVIATVVAVVFSAILAIGMSKWVM